MAGYGRAGNFQNNNTHVANIEPLNVFPITIFKTIIDIDRQPMVDCLYQMKKDDPEGLHRSNSLGYHTQDNLASKLVFQPLTTAIAGIMKGLRTSEEYGNLWSDVVYSGMLDISVLNMWGMISKQGATNVYHCHPGCDYSGVFYLKTPENCGDIRFENISDAAAYTGYGDVNFDIQPEEGMLLLFPPWLRHSVLVNQSNEDRICISFNLRWIGR